MPVSFPCGICCKPVASNHRAVQCDVCDLWIHIKCNSISPKEYEKLMESDNQWTCIKCFNETVPFSETSNEILKLTLQGLNPSYTPVLVSKQDNESFVSLLKNLEKIDFEIDPDNNGNPSAVNDCKYYTLSELNQIRSNGNPLNFFHQNIASLSLHFDELSTVLDNSLTKFDFIGITETGFNYRSDIHDLKGYRHIDCRYLKVVSDFIFLKISTIDEGMICVSMKAKNLSLFLSKFYPITVVSKIRSLDVYINILK